VAYGLNSGRSWLADARRPDVVRRAFRVALLVGCILAVINHADRIVAGSLTGMDLLKISLTFLVPYGVSTYAAVEAIRREGH